MNFSFLKFFCDNICYVLVLHKKKLELNNFLSTSLSVIINIYSPLPPRRRFYRSCRWTQTSPRNKAGTHCGEWMWKGPVSHRELQWRRHSARSPRCSCPCFSLRSFLWGKLWSSFPRRPTFTETYPDKNTKEKKTNKKKSRVKGIHLSGFFYCCSSAISRRNNEISKLLLFFTMH